MMSFLTSDTVERKQQTAVLPERPRQSLQAGQLCSLHSLEPAPSSSSSAPSFPKAWVLVLLGSSSDLTQLQTKVCVAAADLASAVRLRHMFAVT